VVLEIDAVTKCYRPGVRANDEISLRLAAGEVFGLLGPNGAGKTTLVTQVLGLTVPDSGTIRIAGSDVVRRPAIARRECSYQPQAATPVQGLSPRQAVELVGRIRSGAKADVRARAAVLLDRLGLIAVADRSVPMSGGMARLVGFAMAAVVPGRVIVLDEPTNDVDPIRRRTLWALIRELADSGSAVLLVTHNVLEAERCVDRLAIIDGGRVVAAGTPAGLKTKLGAPLRLECTLEDPDGDVALPPVLTLQARAGRRIFARVGLAAAGEAVAWAKAGQDAGVLAEFALTPASLEDVYANWVVSDGGRA
jgi:ABC-2 type transport system ATP-binding protein